MCSKLINANWEEVIRTTFVVDVTNTDYLLTQTFRLAQFFFFSPRYMHANNYLYFRESYT